MVLDTGTRPGYWKTGTNCLSSRSFCLPLSLPLHGLGSARSTRLYAVWSSRVRDVYCGGWAARSHEQRPRLDRVPSAASVLRQKLESSNPPLIRLRLGCVRCSALPRFADHVLDEAAQKPHTLGEPPP